MRDDMPLTEAGFRVDWATLNNALFALIFADAELRARYDLANSSEAQKICSEQFDRLASDPADFVERFIVVER
jgi:hypothetical protein